jgi:hypothetical protein
MKLNDNKELDPTNPIELGKVTEARKATCQLYRV